MPHDSSLAADRLNGTVSVGKADISARAVVLSTAAFTNGRIGRAGKKRADNRKLIAIGPSKKIAVAQ
jgi:hypothetical protein